MNIEIKNDPIHNISIWHISILKFSFYIFYILCRFSIDWLILDIKRTKAYDTIWKYKPNLETKDKAADLK